MDAVRRTVSRDQLRGRERHRETEWDPFAICPFLRGGH